MLGLWFPCSASYFHRGCFSLLPSGGSTARKKKQEWEFTRNSWDYSSWTQRGGFPPSRFEMTAQIQMPLCLCIPGQEGMKKEETGQGLPHTLCMPESPPSSSGQKVSNSLQDPSVHTSGPCWFWLHPGNPRAGKSQRNRKSQAEWWHFDFWFPSPLCWPPPAFQCP